MTTARMTPPAFIAHAADLPEHEASYPAPFDAEKLTIGRDLGKAVGLATTGLWLERVPAGRRTSFTHAHSLEEEVVYVLSGAGHLRIVEAGKAPVEHAVVAGDVIGFRAGTGIAHTFVNHGPEDAQLLVFGEKREGDRCFYPEDKAYDDHLAATRPERRWNRD